MSVDFDIAAKALGERLGERSYEHSVRVARTAADLARIYGLDVDEAALAGLLHDWDKDLDSEALQAAALGAGLTLTAEDEAVPALLHARTGAVGAMRALPELPESVIRAIEHHTAAAVNMEPLDMVVYIADMIEPGRTSSSATDLREIVGSLSLDELFAESYRRSMMHLVRSRRAIHPLAVEVWNAHVPRGRP